MFKDYVILQENQLLCFNIWQFFHKRRFCSCKYYPQPELSFETFLHSIWISHVHWIDPLGQFSQRVTMFVCLSVCLSAPSRNTHLQVAVAVGRLHLNGTSTAIQWHFNGTSTALQQHFNGSFMALQQQEEKRKKKGETNTCCCFYPHWSKNLVSPVCRIFSCCV